MAEILSVRWEDAYGKKLWTHVQLVDSTDPATVLAALQAHSDAGIWYYGQGALHVLNTVGVAGPYNRVYDLAIFAFCTATGVNVNLALPGPKAAIFKADTTQVDPAQVADLVTACLGSLSDLEGNPVTSYRGGIRTGRGQRDL